MWDDFSSHTDRVNRRSRSYPVDGHCRLRGGSNFQPFLGNGSDAHRLVPDQRRGELASVLLARPLLCLGPYLTHLMHACSWGGTQPTVNYGGESAVHCGDHSPSPPFKAMQGLERKCISVPMHCPKFDQAEGVGCSQPMYVQDAHTGPLGQAHLEHVAETWGVGHVPLDR